MLVSANAADVIGSGYIALVYIVLQRISAIIRNTNNSGRVFSAVYVAAIYAIPNIGIAEAGNTSGVAIALHVAAVRAVNDDAGTYSGRVVILSASGYSADVSAGTFNVSAIN